MNLLKNKPIFKNETTYNSKLYNKFIKFHNNKFGNKYIFSTIIVCILLLYCIISNITVQNILLSLALFLIMLAFLYYRIYIPISHYKKTRKTFLNSKDIKFNFIFYDYYFKIINNSKKQKTCSKLYYFKLQKVIEDENYFYLYITNNNAALIDKNGFTLGSEKDFKIFIKKKCFFKYSEKNN